MKDNWKKIETNCCAPYSAVFLVVTVRYYSYPSCYSPGSTLSNLVTVTRWSYTEQVALHRARGVEGWVACLECSPLICYLCKYLSFIQKSSQNPFISAGPRHIIRKLAPLNLVLVPRIMALYKFTYLLSYFVS